MSDDRDPTLPCCEGCRYGERGQREAGHLMGQPAYQQGIICHRFPAPFPMLREQDWCGEFAWIDATWMRRYGKQ